MRKTINKLGWFALIAVLLSMLLITFYVGAEETAPEGDGTLTEGEGGTTEGEEQVSDFTLIAADGTVKVTGNGADELNAAVAELCDGDTLKINRDIELTKTLSVVSVEDEPKTVNVDLGGNMLYSFKKRTIFIAKNYVTMNVYSSKPGACLYVTNLADLSLGGCIFTVMGNSAVINAGEFTDGENTYPGSNISTYSSCLVDIVTASVADGTGDKLCDANCYLNINGGNYFSICSDYSGFVIPRCGEANINIKNANLIMFETRAPINALGGLCTLTMENCFIISAQRDGVNLFNNSGSKVTLTNCVTNYAFNSGTNVANSITLNGKNVFASSDNNSITLAKGNEGLVLARTTTPYELVTGGREVKYYDNSGSLAEITETIREIGTPVAIIAAEDSQICKFVNGKNTATELWDKNSKVVPPFALPYETVEGVYKSGWRKEIGEDGVVTYTASYVADFDILVGASYDKYFFFYVYVPAFFIEEGYLDYGGVRIGNDDFPIDDWEEYEVNGQMYYRAYTTYIDEENINDIFAITIPLDYIGNKHVETTWNVTVQQYVDMVLATEADGVYTEGEYEVVHNIVNDFLTPTEE